MNQQNVTAKNSRVREQFTQNCQALNERIVRLQTRNNCLSDKLEAQISRRALLIERLNGLLAQ